MSGASSYIAIGDIHGCAKSLEALLEKLRAYQDRTFVFIGDYIDRGPDSKSVVDMVIAFAAEHDCVFLRGNHEEMLINAIDTGNAIMWQRFGGKQTLQSYDQSYTNLGLPSRHYHFFRNTKWYYDTPEYFFVHAGVHPKLTIKEALADEDSKEDMLWTREHIGVSKTRWEKKVIFGHTPEHEPIVTSQMIGIDTGCVYKNLPGLGRLTAVLLPEEEFIYQACIDDPEPY